VSGSVGQDDELGNTNAEETEHGFTSGYVTGEQNDDYQPSGRYTTPGTRRLTWCMDTYSAGSDSSFLL
jgi:hypothetical protein